MSKFMIKFTYSCGSWARMVKVTDDRTSAVRALVESLGGSLESMYWDVQNCASYAIADLPDPVTAVAVMTATTRTGAFADIEAHVLLTEDQMHDALALAKDCTQVFDPPGSAAIDRGQLDGIAGLDGHWPAGLGGR
jgi:uncharacterized protein with GYD domain